MNLPLARRLREDTWPRHTRAERAGMMPALLQGRLPQPAYAALVQQLHALYEALEPALHRHAAHPWLAGWPLPALRRAPALAEDLALLTAAAPGLPGAPAPTDGEPSPIPDPGHGFRHTAAATNVATPEPAAPADAACDLTSPALLPAMQALRRRIAALADTQPGLLLAHAYVRYLGDLSGGQVVARRVQAAYGLTPGAGTRFYDFGEPAAAAALLARCRQALADTEPTPAECDALVAEACWCFDQHAALFEQLAQAPA